MHIYIYIFIYACIYIYKYIYLVRHDADYAYDDDSGFMDVEQLKYTWKIACQHSRLAVWAQQNHWFEDRFSEYPTSRIQQNHCFECT